MRSYANNLETKTNKTFMTNITRVRGIEPVIGKEKAKPQPPREHITAERLSESSANLNEIQKDINDDNIS